MGFRPWLESLPAKALLGALAFAADAAAEQPDILLMVSDDQDWRDAGVNGNPVIETPVLDRLARDGVTPSAYVPTRC